MLACRFLRCLSTQPCEPGEQGRRNARAIRAALACARACVARSSPRASRGYDCCRRRPPLRNTRSACAQHRRKRQTNDPRFGKARPKLWAETAHLPVFISTNDEAVRIVHQVGSVMGTVPDVEEGSKRHSNAVATHMQLRLRPRLGAAQSSESAKLPAALELVKVGLHAVGSVLSAVRRGSAPPLLGHYYAFQWRSGGSV